MTFLQVRRAKLFRSYLDLPLSTFSFGLAQLRQEDLRSASHQLQVTTHWSLISGR
jgi:hypothetical protein